MKLLAVLFFLPFSAHAQAPATLEQYLAHTVTSADDAFRSATGENETLPGLEYKQFFLGIEASATFGVSDVLGVEVAPEVTFIWEKTKAD